jgi:long-chain acyl-CoA synthetase
VGPDASLELDLGLDSMERVELLSRLEHDLGVAVPDETAHRILTVRDLVTVIHQLADAGAAPDVADVDPWGRLLAADDSDPDVAAILDRKRVTAFIVYGAVRVVHVLARVLLGLRVSGRANLPADGPFIISPNHQSYLDAFLLVGCLDYRTFRRLFFVGASEYFETPFRRRMARTISVVPVDPDANLVRALRAGAAGLRHGLVLVLFPEGERSPDGTPKQFKKGAAIVALQTQAPIVPVAIHGVFEVWPRGKDVRWRALLPWIGTRCAIRFGAPIPPERTDTAGTGGYERLTAALRDAVAGMWEDLERQRAAR